MRCSLPRVWLGMGLATTLLTCGCQSLRQPTSCCLCPPASSATIAYKPPSRAPMPARKPSHDQFASMPAAGNDRPVLHTTAKPASLPLEAAPHKDPAPAVVESSSATTAKNPPREVSASPAANADLTPQPRYAHDPNYHRLVGVVEYSKIQGEWILRYASVEEEDRYGGSVTLHGAGPMTALKNHQLVRVEGHLINPDSQQIRPAFQVETIRPVDQ
jgi:hypothetical protein